MRSRRLSLAAVVVSTLTLAGCFGSTEPATDVTVTSAKLQARGSTGSSAAYSFFQYWPAAHPSRRVETPRKDWPANVSGPFAATVSRLAVDTPYSFRMCGGDAGRAPVCAQTRAFRTVTPDGDLVIGIGEMAEEFRPLEINARSGPSGENPGGPVAVRGRFAGTATSVEVRDNRAAVVAEGTVFGGGQTFTAAACVTVVDGGPDHPPESGDGFSFRYALTGIGQTLGPCILPAPSPGGAARGSLSVYDATAD